MKPTLGWHEGPTAPNYRALPDRMVPCSNAPVSLYWHGSGPDLHTGRLPVISVIIATRPGADISRTLQHIQNCAYPQDLLEIIQTVGCNPSRQRNVAAQEAGGDILYFLDDDSHVAPNIFHRTVEFFKDGATWGTCGPNVAPENGEGPLARAIDVVFSSWPGIGPKRARYCSVGRVRQAGDSDLIGCNLAVRRSAFLAVGGYDEQMWPQEENDLIDRLRQTMPWGNFWYIPDAKIHRPRPSTLAEIVGKIYRYGQGRVQRWRKAGDGWLGSTFLPAVLVAYQVAALVLGSAWAYYHGALDTAAERAACAFFVPGLVYVVALLAYALLRAHRQKSSLFQSVWIVVLFPLVHVLYGLGQWSALLKRKAA